MSRKTTLGQQSVVSSNLDGLHSSVIGWAEDSLRDARPWSRAQLWVPVLAVVANAPLIFARSFLSLHRVPVNIDYFVFALCAPLFPKSANLLVFGGLVALDWFMSLSGAYYLRVADALLSLRDLTHLSPTVWIPAAAVLILIVAIWLRITGRQIGNGSAGDWRTNAAWTLLLAFIAVMQTEGAFGSSRIVQSSALKTLTSVKEFEPLTVHEEDYWRIDSATSGLVTDLGKPDSVRENIGIVVVESWGLFKNANANSFITAPFETPKITGRYLVRFGRAPFQGSTVPAEMRELCGIRAGYAAAAGATSNLTGCLPWKLRQLGYRAEAMHGFTRNMFGRSGWYPAIGFDRMFFSEDLPAASGFHYCGSQFLGVCDSDMAGLFRRELLRRPARARNRFVYWLTLGTHLQLDDSRRQHASVLCGTQLGGMPWDVCGQANDIAGLMSRLAAIAGDERLPATRFVIVGDHAPPFLIKHKRDLFVSDRVPFVELIPRRAVTKNLQAHRPVHRYMPHDRQ